jgi:hypothetical protein
LEKAFFGLNLDNRLIIIKYILLAGLAAGIGLSYPMWLSEARYFPLTPLFDFFPALAYPFDYLLLFVTILVIAVGFIYPFQFLVNFSLLSLILMLVIFDLNRLQPWVFHYLLILMVFCSITEKAKALAVPSLQLIFGAMYFWGGIHKMNPYYFSDVVNWFTEPLGDGIIITFVAFLVPFLEVFLGIGILFKKLRFPSLIIATLIHLFSLFVVGPLGHNVNTVIWPWNIAMILFIWLIFFRQDYYFKNILHIWRLRSVSLLILLTVFLPFLHLFNLWPANLSFNLYSGNTNNGLIFIGEEVKVMLPDIMSDLVKDNKINVKEWAIKELKTPGWIERKNYINARNLVYDFANDSNEVVLLFEPRTTILGTPLSEFPD